MKFLLLMIVLFLAMRRPPHGGRGLKFDFGINRDLDIVSPSPRRAWIEILRRELTRKRQKLSPSPRRAWIEILFHSYL